MFAFQLAAAILLCACAANALLEQENNLFEQKDLNVNLLTPTLDSFRPLFPLFKNLRKETFRPTLGFKNTFYPLRHQSLRPFLADRDHTFKDLNLDNLQQDFNLDTFRQDLNQDNLLQDFSQDNFRQDFNLETFRPDFLNRNLFQNNKLDFGLNQGFRPDFQNRNLFQKNKLDFDFNQGFDGQDFTYRLSLLKKLVSQLDGFLKFERKLLVTGQRQEARQVFREVTKYANAALLLAREARVPYLLYSKLYEFVTLSRSLETLVGDTLETRVLFRQLERLDYLLKNAETLLLVPVDTTFDNLLD